MAEIVRFEPRHVGAMRRFSEATWRRPRTDAFLRWRYLDNNEFHDTMLVMEGGECLATVSAFRRVWLIEGRPVIFLEACDWFCRPDQVGRGYGGEVMRAVTWLGLPVLVFGGSEAARARLHRLGWEVLVTARRYELPLAADRLAGGMMRRWRMPAPLARPAARVLVSAWFRPSTEALAGLPPAASPLSDGVDPKILELYQDVRGAGFVQLPDADIMRWMGQSGSASGLYRILRFENGPRLQGWAFLRLHRGAQGLDGSIVDVFAPAPDAELYRRMVAACAAALAREGAVRVLASATHPVLQRALRRNRFLERGTSPVWVWRDGLPPPPPPMQIVQNGGVDGLVPYESSEPDENAR